MLIIIWVSIWVLSTHSWEYQVTWTNQDGSEVIRKKGIGKDPSALIIDVANEPMKFT